MNLRSILLLLVVGLLTFSSCSKDDPEVENEEELITTLNYTLKSSAGETVVLTFKDLDGDGGNAPEITGGTLKANTTYTGEMELRNDEENEDITEEIEEEDEDHQFFFDSNVAGVSVSYDDQDADGNPIGLKSTLKTGDAGSGYLKVTLRHEPNKSGSGVKGGNIDNAGGETDIEVSFDISVE